MIMAGRSLRDMMEQYGAAGPGTTDESVIPAKSYGE